MLEESAAVCEICLESYDKGIKQPKILECCGKDYCLKCLSGIYRMNGAKIVCPICRKQTTKNPNDLKVDFSVLQGKLKCQKCSRSVNISELKLALEGKKPLIACAGCYPAPEVDFLNNTLPYFTEEMGIYINFFSPLSKDVLNETVNSRIISFVDAILDKLRKGLIEKIRQKVACHLEKIFGTNFKQDISQFSADIAEFQTQYSKIKHLTTNGVEVQNSDFSNIVDAIYFYKEKIGSIQKNGANIQKIQDSITSDFYFSLNEHISIEDITNFLTKIINVGSFIKSEYQNPLDYSTGIWYYDGRNKAIQSEIKLNLSLIEAQKNEIYKLNSLLAECQKGKNNINIISGISQQDIKQLEVQRYGFTIAAANRNDNLMVDINACSREQDLFSFYEFNK